SVGHVLTLGVMPTYRNRGIGRALLLLSIEYLRQYAEVVELDVEGKNEDALHLYTSVGFQKHNGWVHMRKSLTL
ncbi:MAG TPA: N-acetyltransferase, partial [Chloroflexia bacterium]|nr:N-acetyltransferase [Chloroflexia bacterium]